MTEQDSILQSVKKLLGIYPAYDVFDTDIIISINTAFMVLQQLGVGPDRPYTITGSDETWSDFSSEMADVEAVKTYIYLRVKLLFDPPTSGVLHEAVERQISEYEWRLLVQAEHFRSHKPDPDPAPPEPGPSIGDHAALSGRDRPNQHPINAITGLEEEISSIPRAMTQEELNDILTDEGGNVFGLAGSIFKSRRSKNNLGSN